MDWVVPKEILDIIFKDITNEEAFRLRVVCKYFLKKFEPKAIQIIGLCVLRRYGYEYRYLFDLSRRKELNINFYGDLYAFGRQHSECIILKQIMERNIRADWKFKPLDKFRTSSGTCFIKERLLIYADKFYLIQFLDIKNPIVFHIYGIVGYFVIIKK